MKIIWTFTLMMIPGVLSSISVTGYSGGGVVITCRYDGGYTENAKYFCKGQWSECEDQIKTEIKDRWFQKDRFSLYDDTSAAVFTVIIRDLTEEHSGINYCGIDIHAKSDSYTEVNLNIVKGSQIGTVRGYSGGNVIINYKYERTHRNCEKYVCKTGADQCVPVINTDRRSEWTHSGRFSAHDGRSAGLLRVFITELTVSDSGRYQIVVGASEDFSFFSEFDLDVRDDVCCEKSVSLSAPAGGSVNISCRYPQSHSGDVKLLCRRSGADLCAEETSVEEEIRLEDHQTPSEYWCGVQSAGGHTSLITRVLVSSSDVPESTSKQSTSSLLSSSSSSSSSAVSPRQRMCVQI